MTPGTALDYASSALTARRIRYVDISHGHMRILSLWMEEDGHTVLARRRVTGDRHKGRVYNTKDSVSGRRSGGTATRAAVSAPISIRGVNLLGQRRCQRSISLVLRVIPACCRRLLLLIASCTYGHSAGHQTLLGSFVACDRELFLLDGHCTAQQALLSHITGGLTRVGFCGQLERGSRTSSSSPCARSRITQSALPLSSPSPAASHPHRRRTLSSNHPCTPPTCTVLARSVQEVQYGEHSCRVVATITLLTAPYVLRTRRFPRPTTLCDLVSSGPLA